MRPGSVVIATAAFFSGMALISTADAASASAPLALDRFMDRPSKATKPRRHIAKPATRQPAARKPDPRGAAAVPIPPRRTPSSVARAPVAPKVVPTIAIKARALTVVETDRTAGFASATEPWQGRSAFAPATEPELPLGIRIVAPDEWNELDRAADAQSGAPVDRERVTLTTSANAAEAKSSAPSAPVGTERDWAQRLYDKFADGVLAAALAVRALFY